MPGHRRTTRPPAAVVATLIAAGSLVAACSSGSGSKGASATTAPRVTMTIRVPADKPTIQAAVDAAGEGDLILVSPGTYHETVTVETPKLTIRGTDRSTVILDGQDRLENGVKVFSDGAVVENLTAHHYKGNGVLFTGDYASGDPLDGFRASYLTVYDNGLYGVYAFGARHGSIDHVYTSGHPDAGIYVGQCYPCDTVVVDVVGRHNAVGFQGTNAGGGLVVARSVWQHNRVGIEPTSSAKEQLYPQRDATIVANLVDANDGAGAPQATDVSGYGIAVGGGRSNTIERNTVTGNPAAGIAVVTQDQFVPEANKVRENELSDNGVDLAYVVEGGTQHTNCFAGNRFTTSSPERIETFVGCTTEARGGIGRVPPVAGPPAVDYRAVIPPAPQRGMDAPTTSPARPATNMPPKLDLATLVVPVAP